MKRFLLACALILCCLLGAWVWISEPSPTDPAHVDFLAALRGVNFDPTADHNGTKGENGIPEDFEIALITSVLQQPELDLRPHSALRHHAVVEAYQQSWGSAAEDTKALSLLWPTTPDVIAAYSLLGRDSHAAIRTMAEGFGVSLNSDYSKAIALDRYLSAEGDADGDGFSNRQEFHVFGATGVENYVRAALDFDIRPSQEQLTDLPSLAQTRFTIGIIIYPGFEVLDVYGPLEMWANVAGFDVLLIAEEAGPIRSAQGTESVAKYSFATAPALDILMVPGGFGTRAQLENPALLSYLVKANADTVYTASVCTGSALLAKAGLLDGHRATSNKRFFSLAEAQSDTVEWVPEARWVESGKMFTSSGVSAGMDMALGLVAHIKGEMDAIELASAVEYVWHKEADLDPFAQYVDRLQTASGARDHLVKSWPASGARLSNSPEWLRLYFSKRPQIQSSQLRLYAVNDSQNAIPLSGLHEMGAKDLMFAVDKNLSNGEYVLDWTVTLMGSADAISGNLPFTVERAP